MASILSSIISPSSLVIYDEQYLTSVFTDLKVNKVIIEALADTSKRPISTTYLQTDSQTLNTLSEDLLSTKVIQPVTVKISAAIESISTTMTLIASFSDVTKTFQITSKQIVATGMSITSIKIKQSPEMLSAIDLEMTFEQAVLPTTSAFSPKSSSNDSTYGFSVSPDSSIDATATTLYNKVLSLWS